MQIQLRMANLISSVWIFGRDSTYVELQNAGLPIQEQIVPQLAELAAKRNLPLPVSPT